MIGLTGTGVDRHRSMLERLVELQRAFNRPRKSWDAYRIVDGDAPSPIIFSAPHAVNHVRDGQPKVADIFTGPLALSLAEQFGATAIVATRSNGDPNWDPDSPYRRALAALVHGRPRAVVLDLHGAEDRWQAEDGSTFAIALGSANWARRWSLESLDRARLGMEVCLNEPVWLNGPFFQAGGRTLTAYVVEVCGHPAVQVEIARRFRRPIRQPMGVVKLIEAIGVLCQELLRHDTLAAGSSHRKGLMRSGVPGG